MLRQVFEGDGRDEHEPGSGLAVISLGQRVNDEGLDLGFVIRDAAGAIEGFVVAEERHNGVSLQVEQPLVGRREEALAVVLRVFGVKLLAAGESPLAGSSRVGAESRRIAGVAHIAHEQRLRRKAQVEFRLEAAVVGVAFRETITDEHDAFTGARRRDDLRAHGRGRGRVRRRCVGRRRALAVVGPVRGIGFVLVCL